MKDNSSFLNKTVRICLSLLVALSIGTGSISRAGSTEDSSPAILSSSLSDWQNAENQSLGPLLLWARIPTSLKDETVLSEVFRRIPNHFSHLQLNVLSRGLHSSILYLEGLSMDQLREMTQFFHQLDLKTLEKYDLLKPVIFFDPSRIEFEVVGTQSRFLALKPHPDFISWQLRFWKMVGEVGPPWLLELHKAHRDLGEKAISESGVHSSLLQWSGRSGIELSDKEVEDVKRQMREVFLDSINSLRERAGGTPPPPIVFNWKEMPLQVSQPAATFVAGPLDVLSLRASGEEAVSVSQVIRVRVPTGQAGMSKVIESSIQDFLSKKYPQSPQIIDSYLPEKRRWVKLSDEAFGELIQDDRVRDAYMKAKETISPTWTPAIVPTLDFTRANQFFIGTETHPQLDPYKTFDSLEMLREIGFHSTPEISIGMSVYASSARKEIRNPSDVDLMINALAWVPQEIASYEGARSSAINSVRKLIDQIRDLDQKGKIAIAELRIGSDATMGYLSGDPIQDGLNNPYLSREDVQQGYYVDRFGKKWTIEELISLGDFTKFKIDFFRGGRRYPISLQIGYGFYWRDHAYHFNQNGSKGIQPHLRTAVYDGPESIAIALTLARPYSYYMVQKFPTLPRAIGELRQNAKIDEGNQVFQWSPKFIKKFYNFLFLTHSNELRMDEIFYQDTADAMKRQGLKVPLMSEVVDDILKAINTPELATLNALKRNVNDFREFNEFHHRFTAMQWVTRVAETREFLEELKKILKTTEFNIPSTLRADVEQKIAAFERHFSFLANQNPEKAVGAMLDSHLHQPFLELEKILGMLEAQIVVHSSAEVALKTSTKQFIETFVRELPTSYYQYLISRSQDAPQRMKWVLKLIGVDSDLDLQQKVEKKPGGLRETTVSPSLKLVPRSKGGCEDLFSRGSSLGLAS